MSDTIEIKDDAVTVPEKAIDDIAPPRKRGRPAGSKAKPDFETIGEDSVKEAPKRKPTRRNAKKSTPAEFGKQICGIHLMIAMVTGLEEIQLSETEGVQLATAVMDVADQYNLEIDGKTGAAIQLLAACAMIYAPRALMINHKMKAKRADNAELINSFAADDHATNY